MSIWLWLGFIAFIFVAMAIDLGLLNRKPRDVSVREGLIWTGIWIALALLFNVFVYFIYHHHLFGVGETIGHPLTGREAAIQFFNGWITEYSLSTDNLFIIAVIFNYFHVPRHRQHRVLVWGILGALLMRGTMIAAGAALIHRFAWITYVFGALLLLHGHQECSPPETRRPSRAGTSWCDWLKSFTPSRQITTARRFSPGSTASGRSRRCWWCCSWLRARTSSSPSIRSRPSSASRRTGSP